MIVIYEKWDTIVVSEWINLLCSYCYRQSSKILDLTTGCICARMYDTRSQSEIKRRRDRTDRVLLQIGERSVGDENHAPLDRQTGERKRLSRSCFIGTSHRKYNACPTKRLLAHI
jgi:hypothetical protein